MKAIWIEQADQPDYAKYNALGITKVYFDIRPEYSPADRVEEARKLGFTAGVYWGAAWGEQSFAPAAFASYISGLIADMEKTWKARKQSSQCEFQFDYEYHSSAYMEEWLVAWRKIRPLKVTSWTLESWQGGPYTWMTANLVNLINNDINLLVVPQLYTVLPATVDSAASFKNLRFMVSPDGVSTGIREDRLCGFYLADKCPDEGWDGFLFTNRRLT